jgi:hypothetical protein
MSGRYLRDVVLAVPGDMLTRAYASTIKITDLPFPWYGRPIDGMAPWLYLPRAGVLREGVTYGWIPVVVALGIVGAGNLRLGLFLLFFLLYFGGYPSLQFQNRHYFHLEFITWWAIGFLIQRVLNRSWRGFDWRAWARQLAVFAALAVVSVALPLYVLRAYQHGVMKDLITSVAQAPRLQIPVSLGSDGVATVPPAPTTYAALDPREMQYLDVELDPAICGSDTVVSMRYAADRPDLARLIPAVVDTHVARHVMAPAFWHFRGVEVKSAPAGCLKGITRVQLPPQIAAMPTLVLPDRWDTLDLHQEIRR